MAGRIYLSAIVAFVLAVAHVRALYLPRVVPVVAPFMPFPLIAPLGLRNRPAPQQKPLSRPFSLVDAEAASPALQNGVLMGGSGLFGNGFGLAAATNDLNAVNLGGVVNPLDASISDSVVIAGPGQNYALGGLDDSTLVLGGNAAALQAAAF